MAYKDRQPYGSPKYSGELWSILCVTDGMPTKIGKANGKLGWLGRWPTDKGSYIAH